MPATTTLNDGAATMAAGQWSDAAGFQAAAQLVVPRGSQTIAGFDNSAAAYNALFMRVEQPFNGNIGTAASPLIATFSDGTSARKTSANTEGYLYYGAGGGTLFVKADSTGAPVNDVIDNLIINTAGYCGVVGGTIVNLDISAGRCSVNGSSSVTTGYVRAGELTVDEKGSGADITTLDVYGGLVILRRPGVTINLYGGTVINDNATATATTALNHYGGTFVHLAGGITTYNLVQGVWDFTGLSRPATVATLNRGPLGVRKGTLTNGQLTITTDTGVPFGTT